MTYGEEYLNKLLDQATEYAGDWDEPLQMLAAVDPQGDAQLLTEYLELFIPRLKQLRPKFNRVSLVEDCYRIYNYDFKMYKWVKSRHFTRCVITTRMIAIHQDELTEPERKKFSEKCRS